MVGLLDRQDGRGAHVARSELRVALLVKRRGAHSGGDRCVYPLGESQRKQDRSQLLNTPGSQPKVSFDMKNPRSQNRRRRYALAHVAVNTTGCALCGSLLARARGRGRRWHSRRSSVTETWDFARRALAGLPPRLATQSLMVRHLDRARLAR